MTVTLAYDNTAARVRINADNILSVFNATVERSLDQVAWTTVRGGVSVPVTAAVLQQLDDYEFTAGPVNYYRVASNVLTDTWTRTVAAGSWGTADTGQVWQGAASEWSVAGGQGLSTHAAATVVSNILPGTTGIADAVATVKIQIGQKLTGASGVMFPSILLRRVDANNFYQFGLYFQTSATPTATLGVIIGKTVAGVGSNLFANFSFDGYDGSEFYMLKAECLGTTIRFKVWRSTAAEPAAWTASVTDTAFTAGSVAVLSSKDAAITNVNPLVRWDDLSVTANRITVQTANITPVLTAVWLKSPIAPALNQVVSLGGSDFQADRPARGGTFDVVGRSLPVAVTDVRGPRRYTLTLRTLTAAAAQAVDALLAGGNVLFLHAPTGKVVPSGGVYVRAADTKEHRLSAGNEHRLWTLPVVEVAAPGPDVVGP